MRRVFRRAMNGDVVAVEIAEIVDDAPLHQSGREAGNVDADPLAPQRLGCMGRRAAAAEGVEYGVAGIAGRFDDALKQRQGFLRGVAEAFFCCISESFYICPNALSFLTGVFIKIVYATAQFCFPISA